MTVSRAVLALAIGILHVAAVDAVNIPTVPIGNSGNLADTRYNPNGVGSVAYVFRIAKTEITNAQYAEFLNAKAASDPYALYSVGMNNSTSGGIVRSGSAGAYTYAVKAAALNGSYTFDDKPVAF